MRVSASQVVESSDFDPPTAKNKTGNSMTVLIVEDNAGIRRLLRRTFDGTATEIWECSDGSAALPLYEQHRPDIVLMDMRMPQMDGLTATRQIRKAHPSARIVIVTDYDDEDLRLAASEAGASGYALKQNLADLPRIISSLCGTSPA
jgi:two-component system response regulator DegU